MPDIDMDFDERYRADVIRYAAEKYGSDHVAQVVTFSTIKGKQALRDSARVFGHPYSVGDRLAKAMPPPILGREAGLKVSLDPLASDASREDRDHHDKATELRSIYATDAAAREVIDMARGLENLRRQDSIHAAAVVITPAPLTELVPVQRKGDDAEVVTQYEMRGIAALGLLKMDFLGLRNLSIIERTFELIRDGLGIEVDIDQPGFRRPGGVRAIATRRHSRGLPARRWRSPQPGPHAGSRPFRRHRCVDLPVSPGAPSGQHAHRLRRAQERP